MGSCFDAGSATSNRHLLQLPLSFSLILVLIFTLILALNFTLFLTAASSCARAAPRSGNRSSCATPALAVSHTSRYNQEANSSSLTIEPSHQSSLLNLNLFHPPALNTTTPYTQDGGAFYPAHNPLYPVDFRSRLNSKCKAASLGASRADNRRSSTPSTGMAHTHHHRTTALPHPGQQISARDQYSPATPSFRRASEHPSRSPTFPGATVRRHPLSPTSSPLTSFNTTSAARMGSNQFPNRPQQPTIPPLLAMQMGGTLHYADVAATPIKVDIMGLIDKGFFLSDTEWTCYRRNYFSCVCSYSLTPHYPGSEIHFTPSNTGQTVQVYGFAMCITAVVSDNENHNIELVQHTPKRDKGPVNPPVKVRLVPKQPQNSHHHMNIYADSLGGSRSMYTDNYPPQASGQSYPAEYTFERIQFKQATQNNGKRRAAQQYYQIVVTLYGEVGSPGSDQWVKIASRKSAKMIVRGRSPGHYQNDRRGSQSSGPGGGAGSLGGYPTVGSMNDFGQTAMMGGGGYTTAFDNLPRGNIYNGRHHDIPHESMIPSEEAKAIDTAKEYQYYPGPMYEGHNDRIDMFGSRSESEASVPQISTGLDLNGKVKHEYDGATLPSIFHQPSSMGDRRTGLFEGKSTSNGFYPTHLPPSSVNMNMP
ncbi:hypothetical protein G7046_g7547 [Stylonectria norvegica]|nr:hypothetical protein G7046_g7547 [Stylonectria norvegica]